MKWDNCKIRLCSQKRNCLAGIHTSVAFLGGAGPWAVTAVLLGCSHLQGCWDTISHGKRETGCYTCQRRESKRWRTSQDVEASRKVLTSNKKAYGPNAALLQTLIQAAVSQGKYFVRLITLIGPCHLVKKEKEETLLTKKQGSLQVVFCCCSSAVCWLARMPSHGARASITASSSTGTQQQQQAAIPWHKYLPKTLLL